MSKAELRVIAAGVVYLVASTLVVVGATMLSLALGLVAAGVAIGAGGWLVLSE